jgi:hypothetical protein
MATLTSDQF